MKSRKNLQLIIFASMVCVCLAACAGKTGGEENAVRPGDASPAVEELLPGGEVPGAGADAAGTDIVEADGSTGGAAADSADGVVEETVAAVDAEPEDLHPFDIRLTFAGDISFSEDSPVMANFIARGEETLSAVIDPVLIEEMNAADIMLINNEFAYSDRGEPLPGKMYTFRAKPERVELLHELGVDVAGLANNHVYDYGEDALYDTLDALDGAGIPYVGAGRNLEEASAPLYLTVGGRTIAFVAASRAEKFKMTPQATADSPGILRCYDTEIFLERIKEAAEHSDYCIALVHWGTEYSTVLEDVQLTTGKEYLDAGADAIIGGHSHCLQGFEFYEGKPIVYSLGNFWFNGKSLDTMLVTLHLYGDDDESNIDVTITPALQANCVTRAVYGDAARALFDRLEEISIGVRIDDMGVLSPVEDEAK